MKIFGGTDVGKKRTNNEDSLFTGTIDENLGLMVVADGVGGHAFGEIASQTTAGVFETLLSEGKLAAAADPAIREMLLTMSAQRAHVEVSKMAVEEPDKNGMSCTLTAAIFDTEQITALQIGDSRLYHFSDGNLQQLTRDQTVAQDLLDSGRITEAQFKNHPDRGTLSQSIGLEAVGQPMEPAVTTSAWAAGDIIFACSDGLTDMVSDEDICAITAANPEPEQLAQALIDAALAGGGRDNVTVTIATNR